MSELTCEFHPQRTAVEKCEICNRLICLADKNTITRSGGFGTGFSNSQGNRVVCPLCLFDVVEKESSSWFNNSSKFGYLIMIIIGVFFGFFLVLINLVSGGDLSFLNYFFGGFILLSMGMVFLVFNVFGKNMNRGNTGFDEALRKKQELMNSMSQNTRKDSSQLVDKVAKDKLYCYSCGYHLEPDAVFCPDCGDPTDEERKDAGLH